MDERTHFLMTEFVERWMVALLSYASAAASSADEASAGAAAFFEPGLRPRLAPVIMREIRVENGHNGRMLTSSSPAWPRTQNGCNHNCYLPPLAFLGDFLALVGLPPLPVVPVIDEKKQFIYISFVLLNHLDHYIAE